jgi:thioredoxin 1
MSKGLRVMILALVLLAAVGAAILGGRSSQDEDGATAAMVSEVDTPLPRLVDLGSDKCIPCQRMAPILDQLAEDYAGRLQVEVINVREDASAAEAYGIRLIPTQVFYDARGEELWRHEGFIDRASILAKWEELGLTLGEPEKRE